jgi:uncharacterized protein (TIGR02001 family)
LFTATVTTPAFAQEPTTAPATTTADENSEAVSSGNIEIALADEDRFGVMRRPEPSPPGVAEDGAWLVETTLGAVSDFRRGGISSTAGKPALQGEFAVEHKSGVFGSLWASNVAENTGADLEVDVAVGFGFDLGKVEVDLGVIDYIFPGVPDSNYVELQAGVSKTMGPVELGVNAAYSPSQNNIGSQDNLYVGASAAWTIADTNVKLTANAGIENGAFGDNKVDWSVGANYSYKRFDLGLTYVDSARTFGAADADATLVVALTAHF